MRCLRRGSWSLRSPSPRCIRQGPRPHAGISVVNRLGVIYLGNAASRSCPPRRAVKGRKVREASGAPRYLAARWSPPSLQPRLVVAVAGGSLLLIAWIGWAVYVDKRQRRHCRAGVVIAWPVLLVALALISLPFIGAFGWFAG